ncbi:TIGR00289 family protein [Methanobrevibacter sp. TMH8]|uniref:diphthine--ammonia ligase n=1 Tax=Methanobrevibacter sp. TMH8 TaxID=2848611 RepID=UPI001CCEF0AA|nr:TIGR00289 family protein [Methanobrevibacter sp. TMH8]MBZ9570887.1 TIGR00289 family protein [Methanobrevibacter sp. TMH8]
MKVAVLFSGGKDSTMACYEAINNGDEIAYLLSIESKNKESYMFHVPNIHLTELIAEAIDIPIIKAKTHGIKEKEVDDLKYNLSILKDKGIEGIYTGALYSVYQKSRIDKICEDLGLKSISPLWNVNEEEYMNRIIDLGFEIIISGVFAYGLDESWLGKKIDKNLIEDLKTIKEKYGINIAFEGGEAETLAINGPIFKKKIKIDEAEIIWNVDNGIYNIKKASLVDK